MAFALVSHVCFCVFCWKLQGAVRCRQTTIHWCPLSPPMYHSTGLVLCNFNESTVLFLPTSAQHNLLRAAARNSLFSSSQQVCIPYQLPEDSRHLKPTQTQPSKGCVSSALIPEHWGISSVLCHPKLTVRARKTGGRAREWAVKHTLSFIPSHYIPESQRKVLSSLTQTFFRNLRREWERKE